MILREDNDRFDFNTVKVRPDDLGPGGRMEGFVVTAELGDDPRRYIMAIVKKEDYATPRIIDLNGPDGNAYVLLGIAHGVLVQLDRDPEIFMQIMKAGDYGHLVRTFDEMLGDYFTLVLPKDIKSLEEL